HIAEAPDQLLSELQLLTPPERNRLLLEWNDTEVDYPRGKCIHQLFEEQVDINPNAVAVVFEGEQLTYGQLNEKANRLAHYLRTQGIGAEMLVGICVERSLEMIVAVLGILKAGAAYLPIDPELPTERLRQILQDANTRWILTLSELVGKIPEFCSIACLDHSLESGKQLDEDLPDLIFDERQLAYMLYTSGTTGLPKGVGVNHSNLVNQYFAWEMAYGLRDNYVHLQMARYTFDVFAGDWIRALCSGGKLVICSKETLLQPVQLYALMQREQVTVAEFVPAVLRLLMEYLEETGQRLAFMELLICGSDRWYAGEYKKFLKLCGQKTRLINSYGLTEATIDSTYFETQQVNSLTQELVPLGQGFANTCAYILDRWLNPAPIGVPGELYIGGAGVVRGYFNRPELTGERFIPNPFSQKPGERLYKTGDVVSYLPDGNIEHLGRTDHQVKIRGFRIELGEIETTLLQHPAISAAIVVARDESTPGSQRLVAYVVGNDVEPDIDDLRMYLKACLPDYMVPTAFVVLDCLPVNANGKVDREALPAPEVDDRFVHQYVAPRTQTEKIIAAIWAEVLGLERVGMHDNFFQLGGHSLLAMILIERVRRQGLHADVRSLFITQTLAEFVSVLDSNNRVVEVPDNRIPGSCEHITPEMLPLVALKQTEIDSVMQQVPGGARNVQDIYALTPFQEGILFHHLISTDGDPYLLSSLLAFDTRNRLDCFLNALQAVVDRHDILRTAVMWEELSVPVQVVLREVALSVTEITLNPAFGDAAKQLQERFDPRHFRLDIRQAPLIQGYVAWDAQQDRWLLLILEHHLALDHVAMEAVLKEVRAYLLDQFDQLLPSLPFRNFVAQTRMGMKPEEHEAFFRKLLGNVDEPTAPFGLLDVQGDGSDIVEAIIDLDDALDQRIRVCAQSIGVSAASVFHLAWAQVLALISGKETVVFGTVLFGRTQSGDEAADRMLGMFINTLPVCFDVTETGCKIGIQKMHRLLAELMRHEHASLALAQRCSAVPSPAPLFSTLLNYRHSVNEGSVAADVSASWWESMGIKVLKEDERTNYPFTLSIDDFGNSFRLTMQVQSPIEPQRMIRYLQTALTGLVDALTSNPGKAICTIDVLPESEREQIISEWNKIKASCLQDERIHELFERQAKHQPQAIAVTYEDKQLTYGELNARANRIAHGLRARGVGSEVLVGLFFERSLEMVIGILGVLKAGGAYLPIDPNYPQERIAFMIEDAKPKVILTQSALMEGIPHEIATFCLDQDLSDQSDYSWDNPVSMGTANNLAYVIYTSGSTGKPKGVMVTHFNVRRLFAITEQDYGFSNADIWTLFHSYAFDFSVWEIWGALLYGGRLIVVPDSVRHSPDALHQLLQEQRVTVLNQTPTSFYQLDNVDKQALKNDSLALRLIIFGGEALEFGQLRGWFERHGDARPQLVNMYGITETTVHVTWASLKQSDAERSGNSSVGRPLPDLQAFILDKQGNLAPMGVQGELYIGGFGLARGYLNRADLTAERFVPHPFDDREGERLYRTGDLARYRESGDIEYLGRIDQQVKIRGFRIELGEIESVLAQHPLINEVVVVARTDVPGEKRLVAYVAIDQSENAVVNTDDLRAYLQARLPDYMVPAAWVFLDSLPLTMNGKVDRKALPAPDIETQIASRYLAPRNTTEEILANIWAKVLRLEKIGIDDNFFALGGDSIRSIQVVGLAKERELTVPMEQLYKYGTIRSLAQTLMAADFSTIEAVSLDPFALLTVEDLSKLPPGIQDAYPLTEMQAGMIFHSEQELGAYHVVDSIKVQCTLNAEVLRAALAQVFARHPVLRTSFDLGSFSEPLQLVHQQCDVPLAVYDLAHFSSPEQEEVLANYLQLVRGDHFDVSKLPLIRFSAHYLAEDKLQLTIVGHHAIIDGWSLISLLIEIFQRCLAIQQSQSFPEKHLPNAMRNLVVRERKALNSAVDRGFWKQWLSSATINSFPYLASMSGAISAHKNDWPEVDLHLPLNISEQLKQLAQSLAVPLKCVLLAAHLRILSLLYGERNVTTGLVASTRPEGLDGDQVLGVFLNTLPLRMQLQGGTWAELITQVFAAEREMLNSRYYPLAGLHRLQGNTEFFDTTFNYLHYHVGEDFLNSDHAKIIAWSNPIRPNFALEVTFNWDVITHQIQLTLQGDSTRLDQVQLERISQYYMDALSAIADDSSVRYDTDSLLGTAEWHQVLVEWNDTEVDYPRDKCIHELFEEQVEKRPEAVAVIFEGKQLTYSQLNKKANQLAHYLSTQGVGPE
ncbi:MAG: amino acid adenylation domain-containing protein, partial [Nitrosomonas sp.]|nr:amino acid adenylation domain-containing protein [Nitrosomonas sp.]MBP6077127.1 amino acid adenylation domain-containing protein [Nitrosomonas sp.]